MTTFVDTSVIIPLINPESEHHAWCAEQIMAADRPIIVSDIVYAETSVLIETQDELDAALAPFAFARLRFTDEALFRAGKAFLAHLERGGRDRLLPDFLIGALADAEGEPLLTRDPRKVRSYFPSLQVIAPD